MTIGAAVTKKLRLLLERMKERGDAPPELMELWEWILADKVAPAEYRRLTAIMTTAAYIVHTDPTGREMFEGALRMIGGDSSALDNIFEDVTKH